MIKKTDAEVIRDAKIQVVQDEADATTCDELSKAEDAAVEHGRAAADEAQWAAAKFTSEEFRVPQPTVTVTRQSWLRFYWQRFKSWIYD